MATLAEFRAQYPQYDSIDDATLADALYKKHYAAKMPRAEFDKKLGLTMPEPKSEFGSGLAKRMDEYAGLSPKEAAGKYRAGWADTLGGVYDTVTDPQKLASAVGGLAQAGAHAVAHPIETAGRVGQYYYENPDAAATDAAFAMFPAAKGVKALDRALPKFPERPPVAPKAPVVPAEEWANRKRAAYQKVDDMGARYSQSGFDRMVDQMDTLAAAKKINPKLHPNSFEMLDTLKKAKGSTPSLTELDQWRQVIRRDAQGTEAEKYFGDMMVDSLDDFIANAGVKDMIAGDPKAAMSAILEARKANSTFRKTEVLQDAFKEADLQAKATGSGGNIDNARRQAVKSLLKNKKKSRFFTKAEKDALAKFVGGDTWQNTMRLIGKLSPEGNGAMMMAQFALGYGTSGATLPLAGVGYAAKKYAEKMSKDQFDDVLRLIQGAQ